MSLLAVGPVAATARTWTDSTGTFSVEAELVDVRDGVVRMKKPNGSVITVPIERLSDVDRKYLEDRANRRPGGPKVALVYADAYEIDLGGLEERHAFDIHKYRKIRDRLVADRLAAKDDFRVPEPVTTEQILLVQTKTLLENLKQPARVARYLEAPEAAMLPAEVLDRGVLGPLRVASGGTILAARLALEHGIAINLGGGYHHAMPDAGEGFCIYADMPIAIRVLQKQGAIKNRAGGRSRRSSGQRHRGLPERRSHGVHVFDSPGRHLSDPQGGRAISTSNCPAEPTTGGTWKRFAVRCRASWTPRRVGPSSSSFRRAATRWRANRWPA